MVGIASILSALTKTHQKLQDNIFLFYGSGFAALGIAQLLVKHMVTIEGLSLAKARNKVWVIDS